METIAPGDRPPAQSRGRLTQALKNSLRDLGTQLSRLNNSVGVRLDLRPTDLGCLDLISQHGPISPSALAKRAALHPATMTGVLDRLERGGWIERGRDPADRRGVVVQVARGRGAEVLRLYLVDSGMNAAMDEICAQYDDKDIKLLIDFLNRTAAAGRTAAERLATASSSPTISS
jgi:DNA-binding MarR family transcriptional regulator